MSKGKHKHSWHEAISATIMIPLSAAYDNADANCQAQGLKLLVKETVTHTDKTKDIWEVLRPAYHIGHETSRKGTSGRPKGSDNVSSKWQSGTKQWKIRCLSQLTLNTFLPKGQSDLPPHPTHPTLPVWAPQPSFRQHVPCLKGDNIAWIVMCSCNWWDVVANMTHIKICTVAQRLKTLHYLRKNNILQKQKRIFAKHNDISDSVSRQKRCSHCKVKWWKYKRRVLLNWYKFPQRPFSSDITLKVGISDLVILRPGFSHINVRIWQIVIISALSDHQKWKVKIQTDIELYCQAKPSHPVGLC